MQKATQKNVKKAGTTQSRAENLHKKPIITYLILITFIVVLVGCSGYGDKLKEGATTPDTTTPDTTAPTLTSHTPNHNATDVAPCSGSPCRGTIKLVFSESMDASQTSHTLTTAIWDDSSYVSAPNTTLAGTWSQTNVANDTLTLTISWVHWPANSKIQWSLATANLKDAAGNALSGTIENKSFTTTTRNLVYPVADTGQTLCYNGTTSISCADSSWPFQDADFADTPAAHSFTGPTAHGTYTSDYTTTDNVTGLAWKSCTQGLSGAACGSGSASTNTWVNALDACSALNTANSGAGYAGCTDWRLPAPEELETLPDYGRFNPSIDPSYFPATVSSYYWSSSTNVSNASYAWYVPFGYGNVGSAYKPSSVYVRCVSGGNASQRSYTDNGDGTVKDNVTGLIWQKCTKGQTGTGCQDTGTSGDNYGADSGKANWQTALQYCKDLSLAGKTWRLPSVNELKSLADRSRDSPAIDTGYFPATVSSSYWSSSTFVFDADFAWGVDFHSGHVGYIFKTHSYYVRCVSGP